MQELLTQDEIQALLAGSHGQSPGLGGNMDVILDVPITLSVEAGRVRLPLRKLINLEGDSFIDLECAEAAEVNVLANGRLIARGLLVARNGRRALKITEILTAQTRSALDATITGR